MPALKAARAGLLAGIALSLAASAPGYPDGRSIAADLDALRTAPPTYADTLRVFRRYFDAPDPRVFRPPDDPIGIRSIEGTVAVDEAIRTVSATAPAPALAWSPALEAVARAHVEAQGPAGLTGHGRGPGGMAARLTAAGFGMGLKGEAIAYGAATPAEALRQLVVDDGVPGRGHRTLLLSPDYRFVGIWCGAHAVYRTMCVIDVSSMPPA